MAKIIKDIELFSNCQTAEEVYKKIGSYIENYLGHVVNNITEAYYWFRDLYGSGLDIDDVHYGERQDARFYLDNELTTLVHVRIEEIYVDSGSDDYCYALLVEEE